MTITLAQITDLPGIAALDRHIPPAHLEECIQNGRIYALKDAEANIVGVLRYSLFWQTIPFCDLLYLSETCRRCGLGTKMMQAWEAQMQTCGYRDVLTSTQADEEAWRFYEHLGYRRVGGFYPPEQDAEEWIYCKHLSDL